MMEEDKKKMACTGFKSLDDTRFDFNQTVYHSFMLL